MGEPRLRQPRHHVLQELRFGPRRLQFRAELYNAFNTTQYSNYNTNVQYSWADYQQYLATGDPQLLVQTNASVGLITAAREARRIQLGLRFTF